MRQTRIALCVLLLALEASSPARGDPSGVKGDDFEGLEPAFKISSSDCAQLRIVRHTRDSSAKSGDRSEHFRIRATSGSYVHAVLDIQPVRVIQELEFGLWVRADQAGPQLMARVILPRTSRKDQRPVRLLIRGDVYSRRGPWQRLTLQHPDELVQRAITGLRAEHGSWIDPREAYIDQLVVNLFGGPGETRVWLDQFEVFGGVSANPGAASVAWPVSASNSNPAAADVPREIVPSRTRNRIAVHGSQLVADRQPIFVRGLEYQGEDLHRLAELGFNTVFLREPLSQEQTRIAEQLNLWLVLHTNASTNALHFDSSTSILAWHVGDTEPNPRTLRPGEPRPLLIGSLKRSKESHLDVVLVERRVLGTNLDISDYAQWCRRQAASAIRETPILLAIPTEADMPDSAESPKAGSNSERLLQPHQVLLLTRMAALCNARGVVFRSSAPLDDSTLAARLRAQTLRQANRWLRKLEPWLAGGTVVGFADTSPSYVWAPIVELNRSSVVLPIRLLPGSQRTVQRETTPSTRFTIPGVAESDQVFLWTASIMRTIRRYRTAGGLRVDLPNHVAEYPLLITSNAKLTRELSRRSTAQGDRSAQRLRQLASLYLEAVIETERQLQQQAPRLRRSGSTLAEARAVLAKCDDLLAKRNSVGAEHSARQCLRVLNQLCWLRWRQAVVSVPQASSPLCEGFFQLPNHWAFVDNLRQYRGGATTLLTTDFENLDEVRRQGWRQFLPGDAKSGVEVTLSPESPKAGNYSLRLRAAEEVASVTGSADIPSVWVNSPPLQVSPNDVVRVRFWVRVPHSAAETDGFIAFDSVGGPDRAERFNNDRRWYEVTWFRKIDLSQKLVITLALMGAGEATVDSLVVDVFSNAGFPGQGLSRRGEMAPR